jgi:hypothetical protein
MGQIYGAYAKAPEGGTMFQVSEKASEMIKNYLKDKEESLAIRVMMHEGG